MAGRVSQEVAEVLYTGTPKGRVSQEVAEVLYTGTPKGRVSQVVVEVLYIDSGAVPGGAERVQVVMVG